MGIRKNIFDDLELINNFEPVDNSADFSPTTAQPGTQSKVDALARRVEQGLPLWHPDDPKSITRNVPDMLPRRIRFDS